MHPCSKLFILGTLDHRRRSKTPHLTRVFHGLFTVLLTPLSYCPVLSLHVIPFLSPCATPATTPATLVPSPCATLFPSPCATLFLPPLSPSADCHPPPTVLWTSASQLCTLHLSSVQVSSIWSTNLFQPTLSDDDHAHTTMAAVMGGVTGGIPAAQMVDSLFGTTLPSPGFNEER